MTRLTRRFILGAGAAALIAPLPAGAQALALEAARAHVRLTIDEILALIVASRPRAETAERLHQILMERTAVPQLARFAAGRDWRSMTELQQTRFVDAFSRYIARVYAGYFRAFEGSVEDLRAYVHLGDARDAGAKGIMVASEIRPLNEVAVSVNWVVSDRSGQIAISDLVVEGISLAITQRELIGAMLDRHRGNAEAMIAELDGLQQASAD